MNTNRTSARRALQFAVGLMAAGGLAWAAATHTTDNNAVSVKVDKAPVASANSPLGPSYAPIVKRVSPSVVKVLVTERAKRMSNAQIPPQLRDFFGGGDDDDGGGFSFGPRGGRQMPQQPAQQGLGSGVIVSADGYILTNNHVVNGADVIKVSLNDGRELTAKVIGTDPQSDLAVVKVDAKNLPAITFADSDIVEVGDRVLAVGNPFGIGQTVTSGMVSGLGRATQDLAYEDFIQTDAAINPGNSGGALVDAEGRLIGINTAILSRSGGSQGIGFAIPSNLAHSVMEQLTATGKVVRGYLGVEMQEVTPALAEQFKLATNHGALVADVVPDSPAAKAGLKSSDVITKFDGKPVTDARHLKLAVAEVQPGQKVDTEVMRDGKTLTLSVTTVERPSEQVLAQQGRNFRGNRNRGLNRDNDNSAAANADDDSGTLNGVGVADLDSQARREFDVPASIRGALVTQVDPSSAAATAGLQPGDVIQEINRQAVRNSGDAIKLTEKSDTKKTLLRVWNQSGSHFVVVDESAAAAAPNS
jgi:serine protease Do